MEGIPVQPMLEYAPKVSSKCFYLAIRISCSMEPSVESMVWDLVIQRNKKRHLSTVLYLFLVTVSSRHGFLRHQKVLTAKWWLRKKKSSKYKTPSNESYKSSLHCPSVFSIDKFWVWTKPWHLFCCDLHSWGFLSLRPEAKAHWCGFVEGSGFAWRGICKATWLHKNTVFLRTKRSEIWNVDSFSFASQADPGYSRYLAS